MTTSDHRHAFVTEQQTGHRFCGMCGFHPDTTTCEDRPSALWLLLRDPEWQEAVRKMGYREVGEGRYSRG